MGSTSTKENRPSKKPLQAMAAKLVEPLARAQMNPHERKYRAYLKLPSPG
jgi:hypothetical protein